MDLYEALAGAKLAKTDGNLWYVFNGGHTVNVYDNAGRPVNCHTFGDFGRDNESIEEAEAFIGRLIASYAAGEWE